MGGGFGCGQPPETEADRRLSDAHMLSRHYNYFFSVTFAKESLVESPGSPKIPL